MTGTAPPERQPPSGRSPAEPLPSGSLSGWSPAEPVPGGSLSGWSPAEPVPGGSLSGWSPAEPVPGGSLPDWSPGGPLPGEAGVPAGPWWLARGEADVPAEPHWLSAAEAARAAAQRFPKRRTEYLLRRLAVKHAVAAVAGRPPGEPSALAGIEVGNAPSGAPHVLLDGVPLAWDVSVTDRAGWAVCVVGRLVGCDLELVEPRSPAFVRDFLTPAERQSVAARPAGEERAVAANLIWSAKESALKVLRVGLRRDTRSVEVSAEPPGPDGWGALRVRGPASGSFPGWWRREGAFLLTVVTAAPGPAPLALHRPGTLAGAVPRHSWLDHPSPR